MVKLFGQPFFSHFLPCDCGVKNAGHFLRRILPVLLADGKIVLDMLVQGFDFAVHVPLKFPDFGLGQAIVIHIKGSPLQHAGLVVRQVQPFKHRAYVGSRLTNFEVKLVQLFVNFRADFKVGLQGFHIVPRWFYHAAFKDFPFLFLPAIAFQILPEFLFFGGHGIKGSHFYCPGCPDGDTIKSHHILLHFLDFLLLFREVCPFIRILDVRLIGKNCLLPLFQLFGFFLHGVFIYGILDHQTRYDTLLSLMIRGTEAFQFLHPLIVIIQWVNRA